MNVVDVMISTHVLPSSRFELPQASRTAVYIGIQYTNRCFGTARAGVLRKVLRLRRCGRIKEGSVLQHFLGRLHLCAQRCYIAARESRCVSVRLTRISIGRTGGLLRARRKHCAAAVNLAGSVIISNAAVLTAACAWARRIALTVPRDAWGRSERATQSHAHRKLA